MVSLYLEKYDKLNNSRDVVRMVIYSYISQKASTVIPTMPSVIIGYL